MGIKFNEEDFINCSEFKCEQDCNVLVDIVRILGYDVYQPDYEEDVASGHYSVLVLWDGKFSADCQVDIWKGDEYTLREILSNSLPEEARTLRKMFLQAVEDVEEGRLTSVDEFLEKL